MDRISYFIRWLKPTAKDKALINQFLYSKYYSLPSALADGSGRQEFLALAMTKIHSHKDDLANIH